MSVFTSLVIVLSSFCGINNEHFAGNVIIPFWITLEIESQTFDSLGIITEPFIKDQGLKILKTAHKSK